MRVLCITYANRIPNNDRLFDSLSRFVDLERLEVDRSQARNLDKSLRAYDLLEFDRILMEIRAKHAIGQWRTLWRVPNLVLFEEDTWQNYAPFSKNYGLFTKYYQRVQPARIIHSGYEVAHKTSQLGYDSCFLPKGYDGTKLRNLGIARDIEMAFIGRISHSNYVYRKQFLNDLANEEPVQVLRTHSDKEYLETLNRIRFFISADIRFGEHMIKNFEAMACGCVLFAYPQGEDDSILGLDDFKNVVFYRSKEELRSKVTYLRDRPALADEIARNGQRLAERNHELGILGEKLYELLEKPLRRAPQARMVRHGHSSEIDMSEQYYSRLVPSDLLVEHGRWFQRNGLWFRFFNDNRKCKPVPQREAFVKNAATLLDLGIRAPTVQFWGRRDRQTYWVACRLDQDLVSSPQMNLPLRAAAFAACLHRAGLNVIPFNQGSIMWSADGTPFVIDPSYLAKLDKIAIEDGLSAYHDLAATSDWPFEPDDEAYLQHWGVE